MDNLQVSAVVAALAGLTFHSSGWFCVAVTLIILDVVISMVVGD